MQIKNHLLYKANRFSMLEHLRIIGPLKKTPIQILLGLENGELNPVSLDEGQLFIFQRDFPSDLELFRQILQKYTLGKPVIYD